jgi:site-specific DNA-methyltransferase (adenine-specific)
MTELQPGSVDLVVTSPPYPMIEMWDGFFHAKTALSPMLCFRQGSLAFEQMHRQLDPVWGEVHRVLKAGGIACINIGDAPAR